MIGQELTTEREVWNTEDPNAVAIVNFLSAASVKQATTTTTTTTTFYSDDVIILQPDMRLLFEVRRIFKEIRYMKIL